MTFERFSDYVKSIAGMVVIAHLFISRLIIATVFGSPLVDHFFPVAGPIGVVAAVVGWWLVHREPPPIVSKCPTCHQRVVERA